MQRPFIITILLVMFFLVVVTISFAETTNEVKPAKAASQTADDSAADRNDSTVDRRDAGTDAPDAGVVEGEDKAAVSSAGEKDKKDENASAAAASEATAREALPWRKDPSVRRRPGSYLGGGMGYTMARSSYKVKLREYKQDYKVGPLHGTETFVRVGDAFFEWFAVGFQIDLLSANNFGQTKGKAMSGFGLYIDTSFYPWRGLALRPSVGLGFSFAQAGKAAHEFGYGGPASLSFAISYEFRITRLFRISPVAQIAWIAGEDYNSMFLCFSVEFLKWFMTPEG